MSPLVVVGAWGEVLRWVSAGQQISEKLNPDFSVSERNFFSAVEEILHRVKVTMLLLHLDEHGFAVDYCQASDIKRRLNEAELFAVLPV